MSQNNSFSKVVQSLYFDVDVENSSPDLIIENLLKVEGLSQNKKTKRINSLSASMDMEIDSEANRIVDTFSFKKSPLPNKNIESGEIRITSGKSNKTRKLLDIELALNFNSETEARLFFEDLKKIFIPLSVKHKIGKDELDSGEYAGFSSGQTRKRFGDITFLFGKSHNSNVSQIIMVPYSEFI